MENISIASVTMPGKIIYPQGDGPGKPTYIPFSITVGDNCCEGHARGKAHDIMTKWARESNRQTTYKEEHCHIEFDPVKE